MAEKTKAAELGASIRESLDRWEHIKEHGAGDPLWEDGINLNLVRNHVIYYKRKCEDELPPEEYPEEYYLETPPKVDNKFMARDDVIRERAEMSLQEYKVNPDYLYLQSVFDEIPEKQKEEFHLMNVLNYVVGLAYAIRDNDLVVMRRHEHPERYAESFTECRGKIEKYLGGHQEKEEKELPLGQLSLFDLFGLTSG